MSGLLDLLLPAVCPGCREAPGPGLCPVCHAELPVLTCPCPDCGHPRLAENESCPNCDRSGLPHLVRVHVHFSYAGNLRRLVTDAKAGSRPAAITALARLIRADCRCDVVVPVPPSPGRRPGPHLATALARSLARGLGVPCQPLLRCTRHAREQHLLNRADRARNVIGLFDVRGIVPERVLLVDDILTSGATATAAAKALREAGAKRIEAAFLCRTG